MVKEIEKSECLAVMARIRPYKPIVTVKAGHQSLKWHRLIDFVNQTDRERIGYGNNYCESRQTFNWSTEGDVIE